MRRFYLAATTALIALWGCSDSDLPPEYRALDVPEERLASAESLGRGRELYLDYCALCHGERGDGRGRRQNLSSHPRSFTDPTWRRRTTPRRVYYVIREGVQGTAMPAWPVLDAGETWDVVAYVLSVSENGA
jgi:mono/diheme cytochrome c family protein